MIKINRILGTVVLIIYTSVFVCSFLVDDINSYQKEASYNWMAEKSICFSQDIVSPYSNFKKIFAMARIDYQTLRLNPIKHNYFHIEKLNITKECAVPLEPTFIKIHNYYVFQINSNAPKVKIKDPLSVFRPPKPIYISLS